MLEAAVLLVLTGLIYEVPIQMASRGMIYIPSLIRIVWDVQLIVRILRNKSERL
jgi:hypothetical protein